jgi:hypothetical protein
MARTRYYLCWHTARARDLEARYFLLCFVLSNHNQMASPPKKTGGEGCRVLFAVTTSTTLPFRVDEVIYS